VTGPLLTAREVAELLGVSSETVLRWTRRGEVPAIKLPSGALRYRPDAIEAWLEERATGTADDEELSTTRAGRTRRAAYSEVGFRSSTTLPPPEAARNEEDDHAR
jgi:excisionase family DNA binding protein